jgi:uncharacterized protein YdeI (BOF family)
MKRIHILYFLLFSVLLTGCGKDILEEDSQKSESTQETTTVTEEQKSTALTVAEAQEVEDGTSICVKGYIVASTTRSINNADFEYPFSGSSAIVLADEPVDAEHFQYEDTQLLFPICLTDRKKARNALNLEDNSQLWNHLIYIYGTKERYMSMPGMKKVEQFEIIQ